MCVCVGGDKRKTSKLKQGVSQQVHLLFMVCVSMCIMFSFMHDLFCLRACVFCAVTDNAVAGGAVSETRKIFL